MNISVKVFYILFVCVFLQHVNPKSEVLFSPDDNPTKRLIELINLVQKRVYAAVYMLTDKRIAEALIKAKNRGVDVKIILDKATTDYEYGKSKMLQDAGIETYVFLDVSKNRNFGAIMHNKFALLDEKLWTGSFNWTKSANQKNQENVIITTNKKVCKKFEEHFEVLKKRCTSIKNEHPKSDSNKSFENYFWNRLLKFVHQLPASA